jgi:tRNA(fMet)-specific endonuclease VapC
MLDTDIVSFALRGVGDVARHLAAVVPSQVCMSAVTLGELRFGASHRRSRKLHALVDAFVTGVQVMPFDAEAADRFGALAATLAHAGTPIGQLDTMIAAHALALDVVLVSNNTRHFAGVPALRLENWYAS